MWRTSRSSTPVPRGQYTILKLIRDREKPRGIGHHERIASTRYLDALALRSNPDFNIATILPPVHYNHSSAMIEETIAGPSLSHILFKISRKLRAPHTSPADRSQLEEFRTALLQKSIEDLAYWHTKIKAQPLTRPGLGGYYMSCVQQAVPHNEAHTSRDDPLTLNQKRVWDISANLFLDAVRYDPGFITRNLDTSPQIGRAHV